MSYIRTPLNQLPKGSRATIVDILLTANTDHVGLRLKELGFLPGATLQVVGHGPFGADPVAVRINGTKFGLRRTEAERIITERHCA